MEELRSLPNQIFIYNALKEMEGKARDPSQEPPKDLMDALQSQYNLLI